MTQPETYRTDLNCKQSKAWDNGIISQQGGGALFLLEMLRVICKDSAKDKLRPQVQMKTSRCLFSDLILVS